MNTVAHCEEPRDVFDELEGLRNSLLDWEIVVDDDYQAVVVALAKLEASRIARDRAIIRLTPLLYRFAAERVARRICSSRLRPAECADDQRR